METQKPIPTLNAEEIRILGVLLEKSKTTPEYYPMTLNALQIGCNQKTSRRPVVNYDESTVISALDSLKKIGLISTVVGGGSRVTKYKHNLAIHYPIVPAELAILCLLFLRGPLTAGEINSNAGRLYDFEDIEEVQTYLNKLAEEEIPYVKLLPKRPGQKEARYIHLFAAFEAEDYEILSNTTSAPDNEKVQQLENRVQILENELSRLREEFDNLLAQLT